MGTMKVVRAFGPQQLRIVEEAIPTPGEDEVLLRVRASGICGSDKWYWYVQGYSTAVAGHEVCGEVVATGTAVFSLREGDRVAVNNVVGCGHCPACRAGAFVRCPNWDSSRDVNHGYSEYVVAPARNCLKLLDSMSFVQGCLIMDNWGTPFAGIQRLPESVGGTDVLVSGCGPVGLAAVALAKTMGAAVIAVDPVAERRQAAMQLGADVALEPGDDLPARVKERTDGLGVQTVLECSGSSRAYEPGLSSLRIGGNLVTIGEHAEYMLRPSELVLRRHLGILGSFYSTMDQGAQVQRMAVASEIRLEALVSHTVTLEEVPEIFGQVVDMTGGIRKCVIVC